MSDSIEKLCKEYDENVAEPRSRSVGLFTIPEYPEYEARGMWSAALDAILTTLRYLAPATLLTLLWGQQSFIFKILKYIDSAFRSLLFSNEEQKQAVLQWVSEHGPVRVDELGTVWRQGWLLCGVLDTALPGACAGHPPTQLSLKHAQAIAAQYLGVEPVFSRQELESNDNLSKHQEWRLITYIDSIRQAITKVAPSVAKSSYQKPSKDTTQFTLDYIARGSGLSAAQINHPMYFKIYPTSQQSLDPGEITIVINGPNDTCGVRILPPILGKAQLIRQQLLGMRSPSGYTENKLPLAHGATYLRSYGKNDMTKTFYIPKTNYDIDIEVVSSQDHVKIGYTAKLEGKYEIYITSKGNNIVGSPYTVTATKNILNLLEKDSFSLEDGEEIDIVDVKSDRKVVVRIVDFVTEKMLLKDDGVLEKISEDEAKYLMEKDTTVENPLPPSTQTYSTIPTIKFDEASIKSTKFNEAANKIVKINKVCKLFNELVKEKETVFIQDDNLQSTNQDIPDVVNSTLGEATVSAFLLSNKRDKVIVPENISVSILTEKISNADDTLLNDGSRPLSPAHKDDINFAELKILRDIPFDGVNECDDANKSSNPFLNESIAHDDKIGKLLGTFVTSEFEANKNQNEETQDAPIKIILEYSNEAPSINETNPFINNILITDRPKSPIFKDIASDSDYFDLHSDNYENLSENEFVNPFFAHLPTDNSKENLPVADFIIGAPVSLPPEIKSLSQETTINSLDGSDKGTNNRGADVCKEENHETSEVFCSSFEKNVNTSKGEYLNINSNAIDTIDSGNLSPKKEMRDSAYVSIDENNTLPDNNNNENTVSKGSETKQKLLNDYFLSNMGPAEREIWENCTELQQSEANKLQEEIMKTNRRDLKKSNFTPIVEESDKIISAGMKGLKSENDKHTETDPVTLAFAEINILYNDYFPSSENSSVINEDRKNIDREVDQISEYQYVKSASEPETDVMRHNKQSEGEISEIQANVTESVSVSQTLHVEESINNNTYQSQHNDPIKFGDITYSNIVLEKKKYWDEKIRQIEAKEEESRKLQRKRRPSVKQLRHNDSLSKRKGKQIIKKYLSTNDKQTKETENQAQVVNFEEQSQNNENDNEVNITRVKNWKTFWDSKLEDENKEIVHPDSRVHSPLPNEVFNPIILENDETKMDSKTQVKTSNSSSPVKQEIPEEVFKAFETSPKRFFGTSRKQILNKIDSSLGKPNTVKEPSIDNNETTCESGLVSSRISLFHNISQTEELSWTHRKSQSMHNIYQRKGSDSDVLEPTCKIENKEKLDIPETTKEENLDQRKQSVKNITLKEKRARVADKFYTKSFDESSYHDFQITDDFSDHDSYVKKTIKTMNSSLPCSSSNDSNNTPKMSSSKSEMDIFNKLSNKSIDEDFDKYKSYDELPKVNVKSFISLYEDVSKTAEASSTRLRNNKSPGSFDKPTKVACLISETAATIEPIVTSTPIGKLFSEEASRVHFNSKEFAANHVTEDSNKNSITNECNGSPIQDMDKKSTYFSLPDIELEIVEKTIDNSTEITPEREIENSSDYKSRFKLAKQYFQSLEELREVKKPKKLNECELLLYNKSNESLNDNEQNKPKEKKKIKSRTMPSSEISKFWNQLQDENNESKDNKFMKISEKFHVEDFFTDVMEGRLSRQGSLRGIPHKKAVLEAFRSMENISDSKLSPYELAVSQFNDINEDARKKNAQTYLNEYPYLPTTDPSNFHSRLDVHASGLIPFKELKRVRRNSVPDLRLNPSFTVDL
ncbi:uncharacterized protein LOC106712869 isoform X1 [Papilio machaon]|uniref:uncharacterized protein LOC106712869 isoform X1 n=2 Tax=Papilio machaon TaxID=76193 RepID=UPI001E662C5D|nr:uncharacterized protein LOC106712869 isoform X1 [Papilio machaon]XP_045535179.1 uncharacterized protein LOC106712869 isoform X1 [Papilio machaon]XP_045535180.1 uncharacterized protein LOC106712869 isoform X1 [Papilio machaon]